jgi:hypothetical protein
MKYKLMHKDSVVCDVITNERVTTIEKIVKVHNIEHMPIGTTDYKTGNANKDRLSDWFSGRSIPASRQGLKDILKRLNLIDPKQLISKSFGLSLSDQYWINPCDNPLSWGDINFFDHEFSSDVGNLLFNIDVDYKKINLISPDNTSDGWLKKKWIISEGEHFLMKAVSPPFFEEPINEVFASDLLMKLNIKHADNKIMINNGQHYSLSKNFINRNIELVPAYYVLNNFKKSNNSSEFNHYIYCCDKLGLPDTIAFLNRMLTVDYLIANVDRHWANFGIVRNANTLEIIGHGHAPIFDSGSSLWYNVADNKILATKNILSKPFKEFHHEQIKLVNDFTWLNFSIIHNSMDVLCTLRNKYYPDDKARTEIICKAYSDRAELFEKTVNYQIIAHSTNHND